VLADFVTIEAGSVIEAGNTEIGEGTVVHAGSTIGSGARIGKVDTNPHLGDQELTLPRIAPLRK
jgi:dynactin-6